MRVCRQKQRSNKKYLKDNQFIFIYLSDKRVYLVVVDVVVQRVKKKKLKYFDDVIDTRGKGVVFFSRYIPRF